MSPKGVFEMRDTPGFVVLGSELPLPSLLLEVWENLLRKITNKDVF